MNRQHGSDEVVEDSMDASEDSLEDCMEVSDEVVEDSMDVAADSLEPDDDSEGGEEGESRLGDAMSYESKREQLPGLTGNPDNSNEFGLAEDDFNSVVKDSMDTDDLLLLDPHKKVEGGEEERSCPNNNREQVSDLNKYPENCDDCTFPQDQFKYVGEGCMNVLHDEEDGNTKQKEAHNERGLNMASSSNGTQIPDLNKYPDDGHDFGYENEELNKVVLSMLKIYFDKFY